MGQELASSYRILGLNGPAEPAQIKTAFRRQARRLHPDLNPSLPGAAERFIQLRQARDLALAAARFRDLTGPEAPPSWRLLGIEEQGLDVIYEVEVEAGDRPVRLVRLPLRRDLVCPDCHGLGLVRSWSWRRLGFEERPCRRCRGTGRLERVRNLSLRLPDFFRSGARFKLEGRGHLEARSGRRGDLWLRLYLTPALGRAA